MFASTVGFYKLICLETISAKRENVKCPIVQESCPKARNYVLNLYTETVNRRSHRRDIMMYSPTNKLQTKAKVES